MMKKSPAWQRSTNEDESADLDKLDKSATVSLLLYKVGL